jgi:isopenicillin-N epimerase
MAFFARELQRALDSARAVAATFLVCDPSGLVFVPNATTAVNSVLAASGLEAGDEVVVMDVGYAPLRPALERACERAGARVIEAQLPAEIDGEADVVNAIMSALTQNTRLAVLDHVASSTGLVSPIERLVAMLRARGVLVMVDAAHAPGMLDVNLEQLGADFWTGNFHKWCCAPPGAAALYVAPQHRGRIEPLVGSHGLSEGFPLSFSWTGTADYTSYLCVPAALDVMESLGWARVRAYNRTLAHRGADLVATALRTSIPVRPALLGSLVSVPLSERVADEPDAIAARIADELKAEVAVTLWKRRPLIRLSAHVHNHLGEYEGLAEDLPQALRRLRTR